MGKLGWWNEYLPMGESLVKDIAADQVRYIDYQPGDRTRYELLFTKIDQPEIIRAMGYGHADELVLVQWLNGGRTHMVVVFQGGFLPWQEVGLKLAVNEVTAKALARIIAYVSHREFALSEETEP